MKDNQTDKEIQVVGDTPGKDAVMTTVSQKDIKEGGAPLNTKRKSAKDEHPSGDTRFKILDRTLKKYQYQQDALIEVLHNAQETFGFLREDILIYVANNLKLPLSWVYGVATFYNFFSLKPQGEHNCIVCMGTACYVKRANEVLEALQKEFDVPAGGTTTDGKLSLLTARCIGSCGLAPVTVLDGEVIARETPEAAVDRVRRAIAK